jgi:hypothetical protein
MIKPLLIAAGAVLLFNQMQPAIASTAVSAASSPPSAPPRECDIRLPVWCILQGVDKIELVNEADASHSDFWILRGSFEPASQLIILEPSGCRDGLSDTFTPLGFDSGIYWHRKIWDRVTVKLKKDGSCNLEFLVPPYKTDPMEWAYSNGMMLIRACQDKACGDNNPTTGKLQDLYWERFKASGSGSGTNPPK